MAPQLDRSEHRAYFGERGRYGNQHRPDEARTQPCLVCDGLAGAREHEACDQNRRGGENGFRNRCSELFARLLRGLGWLV